MDSYPDCSEESQVRGNLGLASHSGGVLRAVSGAFIRALWDMVKSFPSEWSFQRGKGESAGTQPPRM